MHTSTSLLSIPLLPLLLLLLLQLRGLRASPLRGQQQGNSSSTVSQDAQSERRMVVPYSGSVTFYSVDGRLVLAYSSSEYAGTGFVCRFAGRSRSTTNLTYSVAVVGGANASVNVQGRLVRLVKDSKRQVLACTVSYWPSPRYQVVEWNVMVVDGKAKRSSPTAWSKPDWLSQEGSLSLKSAKNSPLKSERNTVTCEAVMVPSRLEFARLAVRKNGRQLQLMPSQLNFTWDSDDRLTHRVEIDYMPEADRAIDKFDCQATDSVRFSESTSASLEVPYKAGLRMVQLVSSITGDAISSDTTVGDNDTITCQADVAVPKVTYSWQVMLGDRLTSLDGQSISLKGINLYYSICCIGENELDGKKYQKKTCQNLRGNSILHTANFFDKDGKRDGVLSCGYQSTMGIMRVRFSELDCTAKMLESEHNATASSSVVDCPTAKCVSDTALGQVKRVCKKPEGGCTIDASWLMDPALMSALKTRDTMPHECFSAAGGMIRIEVDYFCTTPKFVIFKASGIGAAGNIQRYQLPRSGCYEISAKGASGGNHTTSIGSSGGGAWTGGRGAEMRGTFHLQRGLVLSIVVGQHGGNSSEISSAYGPSIEDNAGAGGGGGSFVYSDGVLYLAAGGGGGASYGLPGVHGQEGENGTDSFGPTVDQRGRGGRLGGAGWTNTEAASFHGGCGAGWFSAGSRRAGPQHGGPGHGGPLSGSTPPFNGGVPGGMNAGAVGGFGGGGGGSQDNGASGGGGGYSGGGAGSHSRQAGGGGGSFCNVTLAASPKACSGATGWNRNVDGLVAIYHVADKC